MNSTVNIMNNSYLQVDLALLRHNVSSILSQLPEDCFIIPVLKDDAYGLGLSKIALVLAEYERINCFAVAHVSEGLSLRGCGIKKDILVMGSPLPFQIESAILTNLSLCVSSLESAQLIDSTAASLGMKAKVQIKLDIGLHRIGICPGPELDEFISTAKKLEHIEFCGVFSHFSYAGNDDICDKQYALFECGVSKLENAGINCYPKHISCSASSELYPDYCLDAVRLGRRLYMDNPDAPGGNIREIASWRSYVSAVKPRKAGDVIGYGKGYTLEKDSLIATIGVGYGDGLDERLCRERHKVLINGQLCPLLVCCMDQSMVDITGLDCKAGDEVTIFGYDREGNFISSQQAATLVGANEGCAFTSALSTRVARIYTNE